MSWKDKAAKYAVECLPKESCGLLAIIKGKETFWPCKNLSEAPDEYFVMCPDSWQECEDQGELIGIVHSHTYGSALPSEADKASCEHLGLPFYIYSIEHKDWHSFKPSGYKSGLFGRTWIWKKHDCWSLIVDFYKEKLNLDLGSCYRPKTLKEFADNPYFEQILKDANFKEIDKNNIKENDVLLMEGIEEKLNHVALYIGNQTIFHHNIKQLSCRELYDLKYIQATKKAFRYAA
jgi:proteasome lid subunit RPN8/RPN11